MEKSKSPQSYLLLANFFINFENLEFDLVKSIQYYQLALNLNRNYETHLLIEKSFLSNFNVYQEYQKYSLNSNINLSSTDYNYNENLDYLQYSETRIYKLKINGKDKAIKRIRNFKNQENWNNYLEILKKVTFYKSIYTNFHILPYEGTFLDKDEIYRHIVFDFIDFNLQDKLFKVGKPLKILSFDEKIKIIKKIAQTMKILHSINIIHRDLKLSNILLDNNNEIYITDFGISQKKNMKVTKSEQKTTTKNGTHFYKPKELVLNGYFGEFTDSYSFGIMLFEIFQEIPIINAFEKYKNMAIQFFYHQYGCTEIKNLEITQNESLNKLMHLCLQEDYLKRPTFLEIIFFLDKLKDEYKNIIQ